VNSLAARNAARNPGRSTMTTGLMAVASFLIVAMSSFRLSPTESGTGGFDLLAEASEPIFADLNSLEVRKDLFAEKAGLLQGSTVLGLRVQSGDDASCTNLYRPSQPRVLGVTEPFVRHFDQPGVQGFAWSASAASSDEEKSDPWRLLWDHGPRTDAVVPVVLDKNTAMYSLRLYKGIGEEFDLNYDVVGKIRFRVVGLLSNSILQGSLLIGETDFVRLYPDTGGYRYFLIQSAAGRTQQVAGLLEQRLGDYGFDAVSTYGRLQDLLAVQNTYLSTFQSLGALGLLLGTFGLTAVQVRNVLERRRELALMRAAGFRRRRLAWLVMFENVALLAGGLLTGFVAAMFAVLPHMLWGGASVPLRDLTIMLTGVLVVGMLSSLASVRATLQAPLMAALREE
jgi:ABC-type antimicrobial peptide transport system permease subunit